MAKRIFLEMRAFVILLCLPYPSRLVQTIG